MLPERHEYLKSLIQQALWEAYQRTQDDEYRKIYDEWYAKYDKIDISNIE